MNRKFLLGALFACSPGLLMAGQEFNHSGKIPQLVELYTSEGCSSCPPADRYMATLTNQKGLWTDFIPMAFHIDYWDYIGWKDRFAQPAFKDRQYDYRRRGAIRSVYTPGWVVNNQEWRGFFNRSTLPANNNQQGGTLNAQLNEQQLKVRFKPLKPAKYPYTLNVALLSFDQQSRVTAGENRGKTLQHQFVVEDLQQLSQTGTEWSVTLPSYPKTQRHALAIWVTSIRAEPLQAVAGWLQP